MAEIVKVVVMKEGRGFECQKCGTAWIPRRKNPPRRCPNQQCRTMRWDAEKYPNAGPPRPPSPTGGGAYDNSGEGLPRTCYRTLILGIGRPFLRLYFFGGPLVIDSPLERLMPNCRRCLNSMGRSWSLCPCLREASKL